MSKIEQGCSENRGMIAAAILNIRNVVLRLFHISSDYRGQNQVEFQATFGVDVADVLFGKHAGLICELMGASAVWQLFRQKFH